jgi:hypothetical protein
VIQRTPEFAARGHIAVCTFTAAASRVLVVARVNPAGPTPIDVRARLPPGNVEVYSLVAAGHGTNLHVAYATPGPVDQYVRLDVTALE